MTNAEFERLFPDVEDSTRLTVCCRRGDYSASRIARAVEDCDSHLLNLNVTVPPKSGSDALIYVDLRVNLCDPSAIARSLERYGYEVVEIISSTPRDFDTVKSRIDEFLHYLEI